MKRPFVPYGQHHLDEDDIAAVIEVLNSNVITQGNTVEEFGRRLAEYCGAEFGVAVSSGTAALHISMAALEIGPGDEVITTPMTFCATPNAVLYQGGTVVFADIDEKTLNIDPATIEQKISERTRAIVPVDFRGHPASLAEIREIADRSGLAVIEDGAHSIGSSYTRDGTEYKCGSGVHADACTFSFHPVKHITTGEGGAVVTSDQGLYERLSLLRKHGIDRREEMFSEKERDGSWIYDMECLGFNYRITDFQAALGLSQLHRIEEKKKRRREIVDYYNDRFSDIDDLILPPEREDVDSNFHLYVLQVRDNERFDRYDLYTYLQQVGYQPMVHYIPVHLLSYYRNRFGFRRGDFPVAENYYDRAVTIPLYPTLTDIQVERVVEDISAFVDGA